MKHGTKWLLALMTFNLLMVVWLPLAMADHLMIRTISESSNCLADVDIAVTPASTVKSFLVEETIPYGITPININYNGNWDQNHHKIKWGPFLDKTYRKFSYSFTAQQLTYFFDGNASFDGKTFPVNGNAQFGGGCTQVVTLERVQKPVIYPISGTSVPVQVSITCLTPDATIRYTTDGTFSDSESTAYQSPFTLSSRTVIYAKAFKAGMNDSYMVSSLFPEPELYSTLSREIINNYTCSPVVTLTVHPLNTVKSYAIEEYISDELLVDTISENGFWDEDHQRISWGPFMGSDPISITYTVKGLSGEYPVKGIASFDGFPRNIQDDAIHIDCQIERLASPIIYALPGSTMPFTCTIYSATPDTEIRYTTDGTDPDKNSTIYTEPILLNNTTTVKAIAFKEGSLQSLIASATYYKIDRPAEILRTITNDDDCSSSVVISVDPEDDIKSYAIEENIPFDLIPFNIDENGQWDEANRKIKWGPYADHEKRHYHYDLIGNRGQHYISGIGSFDGNSTSTTGDSAVFINCDITKEQVAKPVFVPSEGAIVPLFLTITCATPDAVIRFTTDGSVPGVTSAEFSQALSITTQTSIRAIAFHPDMLDSEIAYADYNEPVVIPFYATIVRTISDNDTCASAVYIAVTPDKNIKSYLIEEDLPNGLTPTVINENGFWDQTHHKIKWGPFLDHNKRLLVYHISGPKLNFFVNGRGSFNGHTVNTMGHTELRFINCKLFKDVFRVSIPILMPAEGTSLPVEVTITCDTPGAEIRFTDDGSEPNSHSTLYTETLVINSPSIIRAKGFKAGMIDSRSVSGCYAKALKELSPAQRTITNNQQCSSFITLTVESEGHIQSYSIEELLPNGLQPINISSNGMWIEAQRKIKWEPFLDHLSRTFTYEVNNVGLENTYQIIGTSSFDGINTLTTGDESVIFDCLPPTGIECIAGNEVVYVSWNPKNTAAGYKVYYGSSMFNYTTSIDSGLNHIEIPIEGLTNNVMCHIAVTAYDNNGAESDFSPEIRVIPTLDGGTIGFISFDKDYYNLSENTAVITLKDRDLNIDPNAIETQVVRIERRATSAAISITLSETGTDTGVFTSSAYGQNVGFDAEITDNDSGILQASDGDVIKAIYHDNIPQMVRSVSARIDATAPESVFIPHGYFYPGQDLNYAADGFSFSLTATDNGAGLDRMIYSINKQPIVTYTQAVSIDNEGMYTIVYAAIDTTGNKEMDNTIVILVDKTPPEIVSNVSGLQNNFTVNISWSASSDAHVSGYNIYRDGLKINKNLYPKTSYSEKLSSGKTYIYNITVVDKSGNESMLSQSYTIQTVAGKPVIDTPISDSQFIDPQISVQGIAESNALVHVFVNGIDQKQGIVSDSGHFGLPEVMLAEGENVITVMFNNAYGSISPPSDAVLVYLDERPAPPENISATSGDTEILLKWQPNPETDISGYKVYRDSEQITYSQISETSFTDMRLTNGKSYTYTIKAVDQNGSDSHPSISISATPNAQGDQWEIQE